jgi:hypothetical protein
MIDEPTEETGVNLLVSNLNERTLALVAELLQSGIEEEFKGEIAALLVTPYCERNEEALRGMVARVEDPNLKAMEYGLSECFVGGCSDARVSWRSFCEPHNDTCFIEEDRPGIYMNYDDDEGRCGVWPVSGWRWVEMDPGGVDVSLMQCFIHIREKLDFALEAGEIRRVGTTPWGASIYERIVVGPRVDTILDMRVMNMGAIHHFYGRRAADDFVAR